MLLSVILPIYFAMQAAPATDSGLFGTATTGINSANTSFALLVTAILQSCVLIGALVTATGVGGQGIQKPVRQTFMTLGVCAMLIKGYITLTTGALGLF
jgi:hypothetical protein